MRVHYPRGLDQMVLRTEDIRFYLDSGWPGDNYEVGLAMAVSLAERGYRRVPYAASEIRSATDHPHQFEPLQSRSDSFCHACGEPVYTSIIGGVLGSHCGAFNARAYPRFHHAGHRSRVRRLARFERLLFPNQ
jgi:hypothetical protein